MKELENCQMTKERCYRRSYIQQNLSNERRNLMPDAKNQNCIF